MLAENAVYTILSRERLNEIALAGQPTILSETKRWVTAKKIFDHAERRGERMVVLFADAANDCSRLLYWGTLASLSVDARGTQYAVENLTPLKRRTQELKLRATGKNIAPGFIRPYAVVHTPKFLNAATSQNAVNVQSGNPARVLEPVSQRDRTSESTTTLFSFGYWGNGSATKELTSAYDAAEAQRGFEPPLWVDVRIRRSVRAVGFRDNAFEQLLGSRYVWMSDLGNQNVQDGLPGIQIRNPGAAYQLLELALKNNGRRVIFFCSCAVPCECHRAVVSKLVIKAASRRGIDVSVVEWPGGEPQSLTLSISKQTLRKIERGQTTFPVPKSMSIGQASALPWGTLATLEAPGAAPLSVLLGPALFDARGASLRALQVRPKDGAAERLLKKQGYVALCSNDPALL